MADPAPASPPLSRRRRLAFTVGMLLIPILFFALLEGGLRLGGYGDDYPLFVPVEGHPQYLVQNREVARRYFAHQRSVPNSMSDYFRREKSPRVFRIVVQGGSSAAGYPFYRGGAFSRMLQQRLQQTFPERDVEVVNTAMSAVNSYTLLDLAGEILAQRPDAVLIYAGHNEYYGALGVGSNESLGRSRAVVNAYLALRRWRTVQLLRDGLARLAGALAGRQRGEAPSETLMARMVGEGTIPLRSPVYEAGLRQFRGNLADLLATYREAGVPVFIATLASNERDQPPFISEHAGGEAWERQVETGVEALTQGRATEAVRALEAAVRVDSLAADGFFALGRAYEAVGDTAAARRAYLAARDRDALRFRAPSSFNQIIREEAARHGAMVVEFEEKLRTRSPGGIIGRRHMLEHLHPNLEGYFLLADAFYDALRAQRLIGDWATAVPEAEARQERLVTAIDSLAGVLRVRRLTSEWPFQPRGTVGRGLDTLALHTQADSLAWAVYRGQMTWAEATERLALGYMREGDLRRALQAQFALIQEYPLLGGPYVGAANLLLRAGRPSEAEVYFEAAAERDSTLAVAWGMLGALRLQRGATAEAIPLLERARRLDPTDTQALYNLSGAYATSGRYGEARRAAEAVLRLDPAHEGARQLLASLPAG